MAGVSEGLKIRGGDEYRVVMYGAQSASSGTTGQKFLPCPGTKGQWDKLKILPRDGTGRDSQNSGRDGPGQPKSGTGRGTKRDRAEKDVLKQKKDALKQKRMF